MEWEIYEIRVRGFSAEISSGKLKLLQSYKDSSFAVRVILDGRVGFSAGKDVEKVFEDAKKIARISEENLESFPNEKPARVSGIYDRRIEDLSPDFLKEEYEILVSSVEKANIASAFISHEVVERILRNSSGAEISEKGTFSTFSIEAVYEEGSGYAQCESRSRDLEIAETAKYAEELAIGSSKADKIESGYYDVVLTPYALHQILSNTLYPSLSAENVSKGRSMLEKGTYVGKLRTIDDPTLEGGLVSYSFDDEGVAGRRKVLVDEKVLQFYSDWKHAREFGITGNGLKSGIDSPPAPAPSNIIIEVDEKADPEGALLVHGFIGSHTANPLSGDLSLECMNAEFDGKAIKGAMVYGNIFEILKNISGYCMPEKQVENTIAPSIRFESIRII